MRVGWHTRRHGARGIACALSIVGFLAVGTGPAALRAGECVDATNPRAIIAAATAAHPDSLPWESRYILACCKHPLDGVAWRAPRHLPSWRLLRNTRREMRDLGRNRELVAALEQVARSRDPVVRNSACTALALYGRSAYCDSIHTRLIGEEQYVLLLAFVGHSGADEAAISAYPRADNPAVVLDAVYYAGTTAAAAFIVRVAADPANPVLQERARWMMEHPMPVEAAWEL
ncbi:MAG: hypothetical protein IH621_16495 [Krumholzibacteria bacterium]|nr:hypothetical protein [Candidatus Krumholzibacteria bacterium]